MQVLSTAAAQFSKTLCNLLRENIVESQSASAAKKQTASHLTNQILVCATSVTLFITEMMTPEARRVKT